MKWSRAGSTLLVAAVFAAVSIAQNVTELQKQLDEMRAAMQSQARMLESQGKAIERLSSENADLKTQAPAPDGGLETEINRLSERMGNATIVRSCASHIRLGGEFRYRGEVQDWKVVDPQSIPAENDRDGFWGDARIRLNFQYDFGCNVTAYAELQSRWAFGESTDGPFFDWNHTRPDEVPGAVGTYQAWLEVRDIFCHPELSARIGRQEIVFGHQFQFGNADWFNGIVHDGLRVDWRAKCFNLTGLAVKLTTLDGDLNQVPSYFTDHDDDELYSAYFTWKGIKNMAIDLYWIYINGHGGFAENSGASFFQTTFLYPLSNAYFHTFGARVGGLLKVGCGLDYNVEAAIQTGETHADGFALDTDGVTAEAEVGLTLSKKSHFRIFARGLYATGGDSDSASYLILYPNRHSNLSSIRARYGLADMMPMSNVESIQLGAHFDPACNWTVGATALYGRTESDFGGGLSSDYGEELDVWAEYRYSDRLTLGAGAAAVFPSDSGQLIWGVTDDTQYFGYLQARLIF